MAQPIRVGLIGANPSRGWAARTHIPALRALEEFRIIAVATTRAESAEEAARLCEAQHAFTDAQELIAHPDVDAVTISVKAPDHFELARGAISAGKHVFCEWPLAVSLEQAGELYDFAQGEGIRRTIGLQGRMSPTVNFLRDLIADGYLGAALSVTLSQNGSRGAAQVHVADAWEADRSNGATLLSVTAAHSIDILMYCLGGFEELQAKVAVRTRRATVIETGAEIDVTSPDVVLVQGTMASGAYFALNVQGSLPNSRGVRLEVRGTTGTLLLEGDSSLQMNDAALRLTGSVGEAAPAPLEVPSRYQTVPPSVRAGTARNTAGVYLSLAGAITGGGVASPGFADALALHHVIDAIERAGESGQTIAY